MIRAGYFRDKLGLLAQVTTTDPAWGTTAQWEAAGTIWGNVIEFAATERSVTNGVQSAISHRVIVRWRDDVTSKNRLVYRGRTLEIVGVTDPDGRRRELWVDAREYPSVASETHEGPTILTFTEE